MLRLVCYTAFFNLYFIHPAHLKILKILIQTNKGLEPFNNATIKQSAIYPFNPS